MTEIAALPPSTTDEARPGTDRPGAAEPRTDRGRADRSPGERSPVRPVRPVREPLWRHVLGDQFRTLRHERRETLVETARRAGVSPQYLSEVERGIKEPSSEMIAAVAGALGVTLVDITIAVTENLRSVVSTTTHAAATPLGRQTPTCQVAYALAV